MQVPPAFAGLPRCVPLTLVTGAELQASHPIRFYRTSFLSFSAFFGVFGCEAYQSP